MSGAPVAASDKDELYNRLRQKHADLVQELLELKRRYRHVSDDVDRLIDQINIKEALEHIAHIDS